MLKKDVSNIKEYVFKCLLRVYQNQSFDLSGLVIVGSITGVEVCLIQIG